MLVLPMISDHVSWEVISEKIWKGTIQSVWSLGLDLYGRTIAIWALNEPQKKNERNPSKTELVKEERFKLKLMKQELGV